MANAPNLDIYIIDPTDPKQWFQRMGYVGGEAEKNVGGGIVGKVKGYFPYTLEGIFPDNNSSGDTEQWLSIRSAFFQ